MRKIDNEMPRENRRFSGTQSSEFLRNSRGRNTIYDIRKKLLLRITSIVVIGAFLISTVFIDFAWACPSKPWRSRTKTDSFLRVPARGEDGKETDLLIKEFAIRARLPKIIRKFELEDEKEEKINETLEFYLTLIKEGWSRNAAIKEARSYLEDGSLNIALEQLVRGDEGGLGIGFDGKQDEKLDDDTESAAERGAAINRKADAKDLSLSAILEELVSDVDSLNISREQFFLLTEIINTKPEIISINLVNCFFGMLKNNDWYIRQKAAEALGETGKADSALALEVLNPLLEMLKDKDGYVRQEAVAALGKIGKTDSALAFKILEPLLEMLKDSNGNVRQGTVRALGGIGKTDFALAFKILEPLLEMLKDNDANLRQEAAAALGKIGKTDFALAFKILEPLLEMLKDSNGDVRHEVVRALGGIGQTDSALALEVLNPLLEILKDKDGYVRQGAAAALGEIGKNDSASALEVLNPLVAMLKDNASYVRQEAAAALGKIGKIDSASAFKMLEPLLEMLKDNVSNVRQKTVAALGKIGKIDSALAFKILEPLLEMLKDNDANVRQEAAVALGRIGETDLTSAFKILEPLLEMLKDKVLYVRQGAAAALGEIGQTDSDLALEVLGPLLEMLKDKDWYLRQEAAAALGKIGKIDSALALEVLGPLLEMLKDNDWNVRREAVRALGGIGATDSALVFKILEPLLEMLNDNDEEVRQEAAAALGKIGRIDSTLAFKILESLLEVLKDTNANVRQEAARRLAGIMKTADLERCHLYEKLIKEELEREVTQRDEGFIIWSLAAVLASDKRNIADEREAVKVVCQEFYPLFKKAERVLEEINSSLRKSLQYDEELFWQKYAKQFAGLLSINPEAGLKFFEYNLRIKGEKVSGPQRMAYLFDDLREVFSNSENRNSVSRILERISKKKLSMSGFGNILGVTQGCLLLKRRDLLKDFAAQAGQTNPKEIIEEIGKGLLTDLVKILEIDIAVDGKAVNNWLKYENPWEAVIAFTTFYKRFKEHNLDEELEIVRNVVEKVLEGKYKEYRYDTDQLAMLKKKQKDIWMENEVSSVEERDISPEAIGKVGRIQEKLRKMVEHQHIQGFVREQLSLMFDNPSGNIEDLSRITTEARKNIKHRQPSLESIKKIKHFEDIKNIEEAEVRLENLQIARSLLILFNLNSEEIETGKIESQEGKKGLVKFINSLINSLNKKGERAAAADIKDLRDKILQPTKLALKGQITIEDTDDPFILAMIGEKPAATCQGYNYPDIEFFRCHPAYFDSNKRVVLVKRNGIPIDRAIIRVMTKEDGQSVIFLEEIYPSTGKIFKRNILEHVLNKAERMGIEATTKLDVGGIEAFLSKGGPLTSTGTRNVSEYVDALGGSQSGIWQIAEANILKPVKKAKDEGIREEIGNRLGLKSSPFPRGKRSYTQKSLRLTEFDYQIMLCINGGKTVLEIAEELQILPLVVVNSNWMIISELEGKNWGLMAVNDKVKQLSADMEEGIKNLDKVINTFYSFGSKPVEEVRREIEKFWENMKGMKKARRNSQLGEIDYRIMIMTNNGRTLREIAAELNISIAAAQISRWIIIAKLESKNWGIGQINYNTNQIKDDMKEGIKNLGEVTNIFSSLLEKPKDEVSEEVQVFWGKMGEMKAVRRQGKYAEAGQQSESEDKKRTEKIEQKFSEFTKVCPDIKLLDELRKEIAASLKDPDNRRGLIINHRLLREPGFALGLYKIIEQLGRDEERGLRLVLSYGKIGEEKEVSDFYKNIEKATGMDLSKDFFDEIVSAEEEKKPVEVINKLIQKLNVKSIVAFGPGDWVKIYKEAKRPESLKHIIGVVCELGDNNSIVRVGTAFDTALEAFLVKDGILSKEQARYLKLYNMEKDIFEITELQEVTKEHKDYIENIRNLSGAN
ncbi:MAG: sister chromatid cohesion protein PDS5 [Candidatus Ratteibacteria bacterium]|nr:sister chromatid cohesion protein PDS5 [Candidatus Ratteibacteria bacterium]